MYTETGATQSSTPIVDKQLLIFLQGLKDEVESLRKVSYKLEEKAKLLIGNTKTDKICESNSVPKDSTIMNDLFETLDSIRFVRRAIEDTDITFNSVF